MGLFHTLDYYRYRLVDDWPWRGWAKVGEQARERLLPSILRLPPLHVPAHAAAEVHMLSGDAQVPMGIAASWSLLRFLPGVALVVHSDGRLTEAGKEPWRRVIPQMRFVEKSDSQVQARLARWPRLLRWRTRNWAAQQTVDFNLLSEATKLISLDTDVLCFRPPVEIQDWLTSPHTPGRWNEDLLTRYGVTRWQLRRAIGYQVPARLNCGLFIGPRFADEDFERLERALVEMDRRGLDTNHLFSSQAYIAIMLAHHPGSRPLPSNYRVYKGPTDEESVVRHYVGMTSVRFRLFTEGWPRLLESVPDHLSS